MASERGFVEKSRRNAEVVFALGMQRRIGDRWRDMHDQSLAYAQLSGERSEGFSAFSKSFRMLLQSMLLTLGGLSCHQARSLGRGDYCHIHHRGAGACPGGSGDRAMEIHRPRLAGASQYFGHA